MSDRASIELSASEKLDRLRLIRSENVGPITVHRLLERFGSASAALRALPELARRGGRSRAIKVFPLAAAEREIAALDKIGAVLVAIGEPAYPPLLAQIEDAPPVIAVLGHAHLLGRNAIAVVGARNASANGWRFARGLANDLAAADMVVVSGLARGIDAAAHAGALAGGTVAVVAGGIDVIYPPENEALYADIVARGAVVAENPPGTRTTARRFPQRNRLISGLSLGVVVVEAGSRSGSLITARMALEQGREVFAVPGSPLDPRARGANHLIRQGAVVVESAEDVIGALEAQLRRPLAEPRAPDFAPAPPARLNETELDSARAQITESLSPVPVPVDELICNDQFSPAVVSVVLLELELAGRQERHPGNRVALLGP